MEGKDGEWVFVKAYCCPKVDTKTMISTDQVQAAGHFVGDWPIKYGGSQFLRLKPEDRTLKLERDIFNYVPIELTPEGKKWSLATECNEVTVKVEQVEQILESRKLVL